MLGVIKSLRLAKGYSIFCLVLMALSIGLGQTVPKSCKVEAYIVDPDTTGSNVRESPGGKVKKVLHFKDRCTLATPVLISNGWLLMTTDDICVEKVTGWMHTSLLYTSLNLKFTINDNYEQIAIPIYLRENASLSSAKTYKLVTKQEVNIVACDGTWVYVKATDANKKIVYGWLSPKDQCSNPFTTCSP